MLYLWGKTMPLRNDLTTKLIEVVLCANDLFVEQVNVVIASILINSTDCFYNIYIINSDFSIKNKNITHKNEEIFKNVKIIFIDINKDNCFKDFYLDSPYITKETFYRFLIPSLLPNLKKCIYLDCDLIVNDNLEKLWDIELNNAYVAGVEERVLYKNRYVFNTLKLTSEDVYINAGVLLLNLSLIRESKVFDKLFDIGPKILPILQYADQDLLNLILKGKIKKINHTFNMTTTHVQDLPKSKYNAVIYHYTGMLKPWTIGESESEVGFLYFKYLALSAYNSNIKVCNFCIYHKPSYVFETDAIKPIQTGTYDSKVNMDMLQASSDIQIDYKNRNYGELTAWFWVLNNFLSKNKYIEYVGFCHYRRMFDFSKRGTSRSPFITKINLKDFVFNYLNNYSSDNIYKLINEYDIVLPKKHIIEGYKSIEEQYLACHPKKDLDVLKSIIKQDFPSYYEDMRSFLQGNTGYFCLLFIMKSEFFVDFAKWVFALLTKMEGKVNWSVYTSYNDIRAPAYLIERFFNVWLNHNLKIFNFKILELDAFLVEDSDRVDSISSKYFNHYYKYKLRYLRYYVFSKILFGRIRKTYKKKRKALKNKLLVVLKQR